MSINIIPQTKQLSNPFGLQNKIISVEGSKLGIDRIDMSEIDPFSLTAFAELKKGNFSEGEDYYIVALKEGSKVFLFDASLFIEHSYRNHTAFTNPLTKQPVDKFEVFEIRNGCSKFEYFADQNTLRDRIYESPVVFSDIRRTKKERSISSANYIFALFEMGETIQAKDYCFKFIKFYSDSSDIYQCAYLIYKEINQGKALEYLIKARELSKDPKGLNFFGSHALYNYNESLAKPAFTAFQQAAFQGNYIAICYVVMLYETGVGVEKSLEKATLWRALLPEKARQNEMTDLITKLNQSEKMLSQTKKLDFPPELLEEKAFVEKQQQQLPTTQKV